MSNRASDVQRRRRPKRYLAHSQEVTGTLRNDFRLIDSVTIRLRPHIGLNRLRKMRWSGPQCTLVAKRPSRGDIWDIRGDGRCVVSKADYPGLLSLALGRPRPVAVGGWRGLVSHGPGECV